MHELGLALEVQRLCRARLEQAGPGRLERVRLAVGELSAAEPELLRFAWEAVTGGGPDAGSVLEIEWRPARQTCEHCGDIPERTSGTWLRLCPRCGGPLRVEGGRELDVLEFTYVPKSAASESAT
jgi:hydrogenase nickel incorporation protein HypA/HybF